MVRLDFMTLAVPREHHRLCGLQPHSNPAVMHPTLGRHSKGWWSSLKTGPGKIKIANAGETARVKCLWPQLLLREERYRKRQDWALAKLSSHTERYPRLRRFVRAKG